MNKLFYLTAFALVVKLNYGQQVVNSAGQTYTTTSNRLSYNLGEIAITKIGNPNNRITQGFFQPKILATSVAENTSAYAFNAYPNPTNNQLNIEAQNYHEPITIKLIDALGREVYNGPVVNNTLPMTDYQNGVYHLLILNDKKQLLQHKTITKTN